MSIFSAFTSHTEDIACIVDLIKEGRCSVVTGQSTFKYMACFGLIVFSSVCIFIHVRTCYKKLYIVTVTVLNVNDFDDR